MNSDIERLIKLAAEGGSISDRQREIILRKAQEAGEDLDEVQFMMKIAAREAKVKPVSKSFSSQENDEAKQNIPDSFESSINPINKEESLQDQAYQSFKSNSDPKNMFIAAILAFTLGWFGAHKFYLGKMKSGIIYLLFFWTFIPFFISIVEGFGYLHEAMGIKNKK